MIGLFSKTTDSSFVEASGLAGFDFIIIDHKKLVISLKLYLPIVFIDRISLKINSDI